MNTLEHARIYVDLPKNLQDEDALTFARAVVALYGIIDRLKAERGNSGGNNEAGSPKETG